MNSAITVLMSAISLGGLCLFVCYFWRDYRLDAFREHLFDIRDRLFAYAADGHVSFEEPAYRVLRARINVAIRYAHVFTLPRLILASATLVEGDQSDTAKFSELVLNVRSEDAREALAKFNRVVVIAIMKNMVYRSFALYLLLRPIAWLAGSSDEELDTWTVAKPLIPPVEQLEDNTIEEARRDANRSNLVPA